MAGTKGLGKLIIEPVGMAELTPYTVQVGEQATLGRGEACEVRIDDRQVSKEHARIAFNEGAWYVTDLGSRNGTTVNRWNLDPDNPVILKNGDSFAVGPCRFQVNLGVPAPPRMPTPASGTYATRASIFLRLRDESRHVQEVGWEEFRDRYAPVIIGYSRKAGLAMPDAEDVLQDVMLGFFRLAPEFEYDPTKGRFRGYLKRATLNAIRKRARGAGSTKPVPDVWIEGEEAAEESQWEAHWSEQILARALVEARTRFDDRTYEAFELYGQRGVPAESVAERLGISVNSVHQAKSRVLNVIMAITDRLQSDEG